MSGELHVKLLLSLSDHRDAKTIPFSIIVTDPDAGFPALILPLKGMLPAKPVTVYQAVFPPVLPVALVATEVPVGTLTMTNCA
jgi:hypothetical protein